MTNIPSEIQVAKLSIEAACTALESLFQRMQVTPRAEKVMVTDTVQEACSRLQSAKDLLARLETSLPDDDVADPALLKSGDV
jgi:hypothetical protein